MSEGLEGKVALVTGGGKGIGRAISRMLAEHGAHVIVNYFHSESEALATVSEIRTAGGSAQARKASVSRPESVAELFHGIHAEHGGLDLLFNNAARGIGRIGEVPDADWAKAIELNVHGSRRCLEHAAPLLRGRPGAAVVNVSAIGAAWVMPGYAPGGVAKAAVEALTRYFAVELAPEGIRVNAASASLVDSATAAKFTGAAALSETVTAATPLGRLASEDDLAGLAVFLASDRASFITGQTVLADGGLTLASTALSAPSSTAPERPESPSEPESHPDLVAVVGPGCVLPGANDPEEFWHLLNNPAGMFTEPGNRFAIEHFWSADPEASDRTYTRVAGYIHDDQTDEDRDEATRWLRRGLFQAQNGVRVHEASRCAVYIGAWPGGSQSLGERILTETLTAEAESLGGDAELVREWLSQRYPRANEPALPEEILQHAVAGLEGRLVDRMTVDTACSSSLYAVDLGVKALLAGDCDIAYCGGVEALDPSSTVMFAKLGGLSRDGKVRSFDTAADGTLFSDGAAVVALKRYDEAIADGDTVLGVLNGYGIAADGRGKSIAAPNPSGQRLAISRARAVNGIESSDVDWVIAHATGTPAGDEAELGTLSELAPEQGLVCSANKSIVGHTGWAAGAVSLIHGLLALRHGKIPAQYGLERPSETVTEGKLRVPREAAFPYPARREKPRRIGVSSFGFGGTNGHLLVSDAPAGRSAPRERDTEIVLVGWSAQLPGAPERDAVRAWLRGGPAPHTRLFGTPYPAPSASTVRMRPRTIEAIDPCHLLAREVAARFAEENGELWADLRAGTGVFTAHTGTPQALSAAVVRCYAEDVLAGIGERDELLERAVSQARQRFSPRTEDTQAGVMPNVIGSRITSRYDLNAASMTIAAGRDSTLRAINTACRYLRTGELDLGLILAVTGTGGTTNEDQAEGAFLFALTEAETAREHGLPVLATIGAAHGQDPGTESGWDYQGAHTAVSMLRAVETGTATDLLPSVTGGGIHVAPARTASPVTRYQRRLVPNGAAEHARAEPGELVLIADNASADSLEHIGIGATEITTDPREVRSGTHLLAEPDDPAARRKLEELLDPAPSRVTVLAELSVAEPEALLRLHELMLLTAARLTDSSLAVLVSGHDRAPSHGLPLPEAALFTGFVKSLSLERPDSRVTALLTEETGPSALAALAGEHAGPVIWQYDGIRHTESLVEAPLEDPGTDFPVHEDSVVLVTGGTGGLAVAMLRALATRVRPRVWLLGRTEIAESEKALPSRRELIRQLAEEYPETPKKQLVSQADRLLNAHRVYQVREQLRAVFGADRVHYLACDIRDASATRSAVEQVLASAGRVDFVLHAAGVFRPEPADTKQLRDFRAIRDTKVLGYRNLKAAFSGHTPELWCNIGSAAGNYGVPGDTDYASANDFLAAASAAQQSDTRELTIGFSLWSDTGYGADPLNRDYLDRQARFTTISSAEGTAIFLDELASTHSGESAYLGERERAFFQETRPGYLGANGYLRSRIAESRWICRFDPNTDSYLNDHLVDGKPTVPGTLMLEIAAEAAEATMGGTVTGFRDAHFEAFIRPFSGKRPLDLRITAEPSGEKTVTVTLESDVTAPDGTVLRGRRHFRAEVLLDTTPDRAAPIPRQRSNWRRITDPYYRLDSPVRLRGVFENTTDARFEGGNARARWRPDFDAATLPSGLRVPFLLLCAAARSVALPPVDEDRQALYVPRSVERVDLHMPGANDQRLTEEHTGIEVSTMDGSACYASTSDGEVLIEMTGLTIAKLGHSNHREAVEVTA